MMHHRANVPMNMSYCKRRTYCIMNAFQWQHRAHIYACIPMNLSLLNCRTYCIINMHLSGTTEPIYMHVPMNISYCIPHDLLHHECISVLPQSPCTYEFVLLIANTRSDCIMHAFQWYHRAHICMYLWICPIATTYCIMNAIFLNGAI